MKTSVAHIADLARRSGGAVTSRAVDPPKVEKVDPPKPDGMAELADAIRRLPAMMPPPSVVEVPSQIDVAALGKAIADAMRATQPPSNQPVSWRFKVRRDVDGLIESIEATPR